MAKIAVQAETQEACDNDCGINPQPVLTLQNENPPERDREHL
jgi:hypothetical protein